MFCSWACGSKVERGRVITALVFTTLTGGRTGKARGGQRKAERESAPESRRTLIGGTSIRFPEDNRRDRDETEKRETVKKANRKVTGR